jgi:hypothetical protein
MNLGFGKRFLGLVVLLFLFMVPLGVLAEDTVLSGGGSLQECGDCKVKQTSDKCKQFCGDYGVNDFLILGVTITQLILGVVGALALLAFVVGGLMFLLSGGNKGLVDKGKSTIVAAVVGLVIVFASYTIVRFAATLLGISETEGIFNSGWFK